MPFLPCLSAWIQVLSTVIHPLPKVLLGSARTGRVRHISKPSEQGQRTHLNMEVEFFKTRESPFEKPVTTMRPHLPSLHQRYVSCFTRWPYICLNVGKRPTPRDMLSSNLPATPGRLLEERLCTYLVSQTLGRKSSLQ